MARTDLSSRGQHVQPPNSGPTDDGQPHRREQTLQNQRELVRDDGQSPGVARGAERNPGEQRRDLMDAIANKRNR